MASKTHVKTISDEYELLKNISKQGNENTKINLSKLNYLINTEIIQTLKKNAPPDFPEKYYDFKYEYEKFKDFILSEQLINKKIVCLAGAFSSGKSSFLNSIFKKTILPSEINPSTSVPTYIINAKTTKSSALNIFNCKIELNNKDIKSICYGFGETYNNETNKIINEEANISHILKRLIIETPLQTFNNIAFLDTPGYTKHDSLSENMNQTDEKITKASLNSSDYIIWFISAESGTISNEDIKFLLDIKKEIPKFFIVSKADKLTNSELDSVVEQIRTTLHIKGIPYIDILTYSKREPLKYDAMEIYEILENFNKTKYEVPFAKNFKRLFISCSSYYENIIYNENRRLNKINTAITLTDNKIAVKNLNSLISDIKDIIKETRELLLDLNSLQNDFFTEIKNISDFVDIDMPVPSDINFIKEKSLDQLKLLKQYREKNSIKKNAGIYDEIKHYYKNLEEQSMSGNIYDNYESIVDTVKTNMKSLTINDSKLCIGNANYITVATYIIKNLSISKNNLIGETTK